MLNSKRSSSFSSKLLSQVDQLKKQDMSEVTFDVPSGAAPLPQSEVLEIVLQQNNGLNKELRELRQRFRDTSQIPDEYRCPITMEVMQYPVIGTDGNTYEQSAITAWLKYSSTSPLTREPVQHSLLPNRNLKKLIDHWMEGALRK